MQQTLQTAAAWLAAIHPDLPWLALSLGTFVAIYLVRRWFPAAWERFVAVVPITVDTGRVLVVLRKAWQAAPSALLGAALPALASGGDVEQALRGALFGLIAPLVHELAKLTPWLPYRGAAELPARRTLPPLPLLLLAALLALFPACGGGAAPAVTAHEAYEAARSACAVYALAPPDARTPEADEACAELADVCTDPAPAPLPTEDDERQIPAGSDAGA